MGVTGTNDKMSSVFPGAELVVNFTTITETVKKKNSDGSYTGAWLLFIIMKRLEMVSLNSDCFCWLQRYDACDEI